MCSNRCCSSQLSQLGKWWFTVSQEGELRLRFDTLSQPSHSLTGRCGIFKMRRPESRASLE
jgi:hypothetical protein